MISEADSAPANFSRERLRLARLRAGINLRELADRVGVSHAAISQYESGRSRPGSAVMAQLAFACGVPRQFLTHSTRPVTLAGLDGTHFRSLRSTTKQSRGQAWTWSEIVLDVADALERFVQLPAPQVPAYTLDEHSSRDDVRAAAEHVRAEWSLPNGPVGHLVRHMEAHGVVVCRLPIADDGIDAYSQNSGDRPVVILVTNKDDAARSRFDAAHELGHLVCHPEADASGGHERQAQSFAAELLMPEAEMRKVLPRRFNLNTYARLKGEWGVSIAALLYRSRTLDIITEAAYRRAVVEMNATYGRRREPFPLTRPDDPTLLANAFAIAADHGVAIERLADLANLSESDVETVISGGKAMPLVRPGVPIASIAP
ncbi:helix-turn-helix domain-containing protein [Micromonospora sp. DT81.3]|uniref:helix-turn-helix domain-containing protein n=1 Tax=Micromonospora sp. DT81.3 TaxID=3416523 RepID=UPI003CEA4C68